MTTPLKQARDDIDTMGALSWALKHEKTIRALLDRSIEQEARTYQIGDFVRKKGDKGQWHGRVCGHYSTDCTPDGVAVESIFEKNSVQIYPASAVEPWVPQEALREQAKGV